MVTRFYPLIQPYTRLTLHTLHQNSSDKYQLDIVISGTIAGFLRIRDEQECKQVLLSFADKGRVVARQVDLGPSVKKTFARKEWPGEMQLISEFGDLTTVGSVLAEKEA
jgi:hypothetical protein